jgi:hypothetical protein
MVGDPNSTDLQIIVFYSVFASSIPKEKLSAGMRKVSSPNADGKKYSPFRLVSEYILKQIFKTISRFVDLLFS